jgi:hypothetical protein
LNKLTEEQTWTLIERMTRRFQPLWDTVTLRQKHYYQMQEVDPPMLEGYEGHARQVSILRDTLIEGKARLQENAFQLQVSAPKKGATLEENASNAELALVTMFDDLFANTGIDLQGGLIDGLYRDCYGVLHWYLADTDMNAAAAEVDYEETDEPDEPERYTKDDYADIDEDGKQIRSKAKKYRETDESLMERRALARAAAKPPWFAEVIPATQFAFVRDKSLIGEFKYGLTAQVIPFIDWFDEAKKWSMEERPLPIDVGRDGTKSQWSPSNEQEEQNVTLYKLWSRDYVYEYVKDCPEDMEGVDKFRCVPNRQKIVPFALAVGAVTLHDDPVLAYEPALTSVYRLKPALDRFVANMGALAESGAIKRFMLQPKDNSLPPLTDDEGHPKLFSGNALEALKVPEGYDLIEVNGSGVSGDYARLGELLTQEMKDALPNTGIVEISGTAGPAWTMRQAIQQANVEPKMYVQNIARPLQVMNKNIIEVNADAENGPGDIAFYPMTKTSDGRAKKDTDTLITVKPEEWKGLVAGASIGAESATEKISTQQHGVEMWQAGYLSEIDVIRDYEMQPNAEDVYAARQVAKYSEKNIDPTLLRAAAAEWGGSKFAMLPVSKPGDPPFVDATGRAVMPAEVLQANGIQVPQPMNQAVGGTMGAPGAVMPDLGQPAGGQGMQMPAGLPG